MAISEGARVLVTGATGFVGASVTRRLLDTRFEVHALVRPGSAPWRLADVLPRLRLHEADLTVQGSIQDVLAAARPTIVVHCAAHGAYESQSDARTILETNVVGSAELFTGCVARGVGLAVNVGSSSEYGFRSEAMREVDRLEPNSVYAAAKAAQTHLACLMSRQRQTTFVTFRLFSVYGPFEEPSRLVPTLIRRARAGEDFDLATPNIVRDFVYVDDVVDALVDFPKALGANGEVFNLGSGRETTLAELVEAVLEVTGGASRPRWGAFPARPWDTTAWRADVGRARDRLGWSPRHDLREGLAKTLAWQDAREREHAAERS